MQNATIEERVALLEIQVVEIQEDVSGLDEDVTLLEGDVNFLFDETVIQDERIFNLEQTSFETKEDVESNYHLIVNQSFDRKKHRALVKCLTFHFRSRGHYTGAGLQSNGSRGERRG